MNAIIFKRILPILFLSTLFGINAKPHKNFTLQSWGKAGLLNQPMHAIESPRVSKETTANHIFLPQSFNSISEVKEMTSPKTVQLAWDFDDVLFDKNKKGIVGQAIKHSPTMVKHSVKIGWGYLKYGLTGKKNKQVRLVKDLRNMKGQSAGAYRARLEAYDKKVGNLVDAFGNQKIAKKGMPQLIAQLHAAGYKQRLLTNASTSMMNKLMKKRANKAFFANFDGMTSVVYRSNKPVVKKPNPAYFKQHINRFNKTGQTIIFIDDKLKNVQAAQKEGMIGILFINPQTLRTDLSKLGVL